MKQLILLLALCLTTHSFGSEQKDPFAPEGGAKWHLESIEDKPYLLEVAYGEHVGIHPDMSSKLEAEVDPTFLEVSTRLSISISANESGEFEEHARHKLRYQIARNTDGSFDLKVYLKTIDGGVREINTDIRLKDSKWIVFSEARQTSNGVRQPLYTTAIRVTEKVNKTE